MGKLLGRQLNEWGGSRERKVGLVDKWGPFWILSEEVAFLLSPEWRKEASHVRIRGMNILEGTVRCKGTQSNGHTSLSTCGSISPCKLGAVSAGEVTCFCFSVFAQK